MMRRKHLTTLPLLLSLLLASCNVVKALYEDQIGLFDWHKKQIGTPIPSNVYFERVDGQVKLLVGTQKDVVAQLNVKTGEIVWRQLLAPAESLIDVQVCGNAYYTLSTAANSAYIKSWNPSTGFIQSTESLSLLKARNGKLQCDKSGAIVASKPEIQENKNAIVFGDQDRVKVELSGKQDKDQVIVVVERTVGGKTERKETKLKVAAESKEVKITKLGTDIPLFSIDSGKHSAVCIVNADGSVNVIRRFDEMCGRIFMYECSLLMYTSPIEIDGITAVARIAKKNETAVAIEIFDISTTKDIAVFTVQHSASSTGPITQAYLNLFSRKSSDIPGVRLLLITADGDLHLYRNSLPKVFDETLSPIPIEAEWTREESLAEIVSAEFVELPEKKMWTQDVDELDEHGDEIYTVSPLVRYLRRVRKHTTELLQLVSNPTSLIQSLLSTMSSKSNVKSEIHLFRDDFGFRKLLLFLSKSGKLIAVESNSAKVVWSKWLGMGHRAVNNNRNHVDRVTMKKLLQLRSAVVKYPPVIAAVVEEKSKNGAATIAYRLDALTGELLDFDGVGAGLAKFSTAITQINKMPFDEGVEKLHVYAFVDEDKKVYLYPDTAETQKQLAQAKGSLHFYQIKAKSSTAATGFRLPLDNSTSGSLIDTWNFQLREGEKLVGAGQRPANDKVASLGRVLGNRSVLYKYLNPNLITIATSSGSTLNIYLLDSASGSILYSVQHHNTDTSTYPIQIIQADHWVAYIYWRNPGKGGKGTKGFVATVLELFESDVPDVRVESNTFSSFSTLRPSVLSQSYIFPHAVNSVGVTTTRNGISTRDLLFSVNSNQILAMPKRFLDPRRPIGTPSADDKEEMLIPYQPVLPDDPKMIISYTLEVLGTTTILTTPAILESTSMVLTYGLDLFFTRQTPSGSFDVLSEDFGKSSVFVAMVALFFGCLAGSKMLKRKKLYANWA